MRTYPEIRRAELADIPELARLVAAIAAYHESIDERARYDWDSIRNAPEWLKIVLARDHHAVWVADMGDGNLVGYLWVHLRRQRPGVLPRLAGYIDQAFIEAAWRGKGVMRPMLANAMAWFRQKNISVITLGVLHRNWIGSAAWHKFGFEDYNEERMLILKPPEK